MPTAKTIVQVIGTLQGSGVLVLLDDQPVILTNSHNLEGKNSADILLPGTTQSVYSTSYASGFREVDFSLSGKAKVLFDFPISDFAILALPETLSANAKMIATLYADSNGRFCRTKQDGCSKGFHPSENAIGLYGSTAVAAIIDGIPTHLDLLQNWEAGTIKDTFISGGDNDVIGLPVYARPGVSGGAFYNKGRLFGLVTKVSLAGEPLAYAIPMKTIADVLSTENYKENAAWIDAGPAGKALQVQDGTDIILSGSQSGNLENGGGETGNGGGETGNGGGETGNGGGSASARYWKIKISDGYTSQDVQTVNPFFHKSQSFSINGRKVAYLEIDGEPTGASLAMYLWYKHNKPSKLKIRFEDDGALQELDQKRSKIPLPLQTGRLYIRANNATEYSQYSANSGGFLNGSEPLFPKKNGNWPAPKDDPMAPPPIGDYGAAEKDADGYFENYPFGAKQSPGMILDVKLPDNYFLGLSEDEKNYPLTILQIDADFSEARVITRNTAGKDKGQSRAVVLSRRSSPSIGTMILRSAHDEDQVAIVFDGNHLENLDRVFVNIGSRSISEFSTCLPDEDCIR